MDLAPKGLAPRALGAADSRGAEAREQITSALLRAAHWYQPIGRGCR